MKFIRYIPFFCFYLLTCCLFGQDIHFSQFNGSLLNISPGYTGLFNGDYRVGAIYRSQWQTVPVSYSTFNLNAEARIKPKQFTKDMIGIGMFLNNDRAGDAQYSTTQIYLNGNYICNARPNNGLILTLGASLGWCKIGFDYSKMTFDNQYDGFQFNRSLSSNEKFNWSSSNYLDLNIGTAIQYNIKQKHNFVLAFALHHLNSPVITYQGNDLSKLDFKITNCLSYTRPINEKIDLLIEALITTQGKNYELIPHASVKFFMNTDYSKAILAGLCLRTRDAVIFRLGYNYKTMQSGISYDINISEFNIASNRRGGFEIFINYIINIKPSFVAKKRPCPVFM